MTTVFSFRCSLFSALPCWHANFYFKLSCTAPQVKKVHRLVVFVFKMFFPCFPSSDRTIRTRRRRQVVALVTNETPWCTLFRFASVVRDVQDPGRQVNLIGSFSPKIPVSMVLLAHLIQQLVLANSHRLCNRSRNNVDTLFPPWRRIKLYGLSSNDWPPKCFRPDDNA